MAMYEELLYPMGFISEHNEPFRQLHPPTHVHQAGGCQVLYTELMGLVVVSRTKLREVVGSALE